MDELVVYQAGLPRYPRIFTRDFIIAAEAEFAVTAKVMELEYKGDFIV